MQEGNYIKINRKILDWEWYGNINTKILFLHMLLKANWKDGKFEGTTVPRGSFISSYPRLATECDLTVNELRTALKHLVSTGEVTVKAHAKYSVFTVNNYCQYQDINSQSTDKSQSDNTQLTDNAQSINSLLTTIEERKEGKKGRKEEGNKKEVPKGTKKKEPPVYYPNDEKLNNAFCDFVQMRKQIKKPMTDRAVELMMKKLESLSKVPFSDVMDNDLAIKILEQSIVKCWQDIYPLKGEDSGKKDEKIDWSSV